MSRYYRKRRPGQCLICLNFRPARDEHDPNLKDIAPWTKDRCVAGWEYWWEFDKEKELLGVTVKPCKDFQKRVKAGQVVG